MSEAISKTLGNRRYWLERLIGAPTFVSAFEQDTTVLKEYGHRLRTENSLKAIVSALGDHLFYRVRTDWSTRASVGYIFEQLDVATYLEETVTKSLITTTSALLRHQDP